MAKTTRRARPMAPEHRREAILDAVVPLVLEYGPAVTSKQIAEAACVGEGTLFRAFDDKESIVRAAVEKYLEPGDLRDRLRHIARDQPLEGKVVDILAVLRERFSKVVRLAGLVDDPRSTHQAEQRRAFAEIIAEILAADADELTVPPERVALVARMLAIGAALPPCSSSGIDDDELARVLLYGIVRRSREKP